MKKNAVCFVGQDFIKIQEEVNHMFVCDYARARTHVYVCVYVRACVDGCARACILVRAPVCG